MNFNSTPVIIALASVIAFEIGMSIFFTQQIKPRAIRSGRRYSSWFALQKRYFVALFFDKGNPTEESFANRFNFRLFFHLPIIVAGIVSALLATQGVIPTKYGIIVPVVGALASFIRVRSVLGPQEAMVGKAFEISNANFSYGGNRGRMAMSPYNYVRIKTWNGANQPGITEITVPPTFSTAEHKKRTLFENHFESQFSPPDGSGYSYVFDWQPNKNRVVCTPVPPLPTMAPLEDYDKQLSKLKPWQIGFGVDARGKVVYWDLTEIPHMLLGGSTGMGKSAMQSCILHWCLERNRQYFKLYGIDQKRVELSMYKGFPNFMAVGITPEETYEVLKEVHTEMFRRFSLMNERNVNNLKKIDPDAEEFPFILVLLDEAAQALESLGSGSSTPEDKELSAIIGAVGRLVAEITQLGRAARVHLLIATQRTSVQSLGARGGNIRENSQMRVAVGPMTDGASKMALDSLTATYTPEIKGRAVVAHMVGNETKCQIFWFDGEEWAKRSPLNLDNGSTHESVIKDDFSSLGGFAPDEDQFENLPETGTLADAFGINSFDSTQEDVVESFEDIERDALNWGFSQPDFSNSSLFGTKVDDSTNESQSIFSKNNISFSGGWNS